MGFYSWFNTLFRKNTQQKSEISYFALVPSNTSLSYGECIDIQPQISLKNDAIAYFKYYNAEALILSDNISYSSNHITAYWNGNNSNTYYPCITGTLTTVSGLVKTTTSPTIKVLPHTTNEKTPEIKEFSINLSASCISENSKVFVTPYVGLANDSIKCVYYATSNNVSVTPTFSYSSNPVQLSVNSYYNVATEEQGVISAQLITSSGLSKKAYAYINVHPVIKLVPSINSFRVDTSAKTISYNGTTTLIAYADISYDGIKSITWVTNSKKIKLSYSAGSTNTVIAQNTASTASLVKVYSYLETNSGLKTSTYVNIRVTGQPTGYTTYTNNNITYTYYNGQISYYSYYNGISYYTYYI